MAVTNSIPPQAYTRDVLVKAIEWSYTQPLAIREKATSADLLVSYYIQACRRNSANLEAPVSQENFKADLKHLAEGLKQFEDPIAPPPHTPSRFPSYGTHDPHAGKVEPLFAPQHQPPPQAQSVPQMQTIPDHHYVPPSYQAHTQGHVSHSPAYTQDYPPAPSAFRPAPAAPPPPQPVYAAPAPPPQPMAPTAKPQGPLWAIDGRSLAVARELQDRLNLSNEGEAIRFLISLGVQRARELFP